MLEEKKDLITHYIPRTIMLHHYVEFRLALRTLVAIQKCKYLSWLCLSHFRLLIEVQLKLGEEENSGQKNGNIWSEFVGDLWGKHLPHLRGKLYRSLFPVTDRYGFQESNDEDETKKFQAALLKVANEVRDKNEKVKEPTDSGSFTLLGPSMEEPFTVISRDIRGHTYDLQWNSSGEWEKLQEVGEKVEEKTLSDPYQCKYIVSHACMCHRTTQEV